MLVSMKGLLGAKVAPAGMNLTRIIYALFSFVIISLFSCQKNTDEESDIQPVIDSEINMEETVDAINVPEIKYLQEDYTRDDLLMIMDFRPYVTYKVSKEELEKQEYFTHQELVNSIDLIKLIDISTYFMNNAFRKGYVDEQYFHSVEYITVNNEEYGASKNIKRNDWVIILSYLFFETDDPHNGMVREQIAMLPDYTIIISSVNFEGVELD